MNHKKVGKKFGRVKRQREALLKTLLGSLILHEKIATTEIKAKEMKRLIDPLINKAKKAKANPEKKVAVLRDMGKYLSKVAVGKLNSDFSDKFDERTSGYVRVTKTGPRKSDGARMAIIEFV